MDEQKKYEVIKHLVDNGGNKERAAMTLGITKRQVNRLIKAYKEKGKSAFLHGNRGRKPITTIPDDTRKDVVDLYRTKYYEANFTHFTELLERIEGITLSVSCVTNILRLNMSFPRGLQRQRKKRIKKQLEEEQKSRKDKEGKPIRSRKISLQLRTLIPDVPDVLISAN